MDFKKPSVALHLPRMGEGKKRHTDHIALLDLGVTVAYKKRPAGVTYPTVQQKNHILAAAKRARTIVRIANDELAKVVLLRKKESQNFINTMDTHFGLIEGDTANNYLKDNTVNKKFSIRSFLKKDRRWVLNKIREKMLSLSFHLNTGIYLIDLDLDSRDIYNGVDNRQEAREADSVEEGYVYNRAKGSLRHMFGFRNGEIHVHFSDLQAYSVDSFARIIIHEATHKYLSTVDHFYAWNANYYQLKLQDCLNNADSYAWAALSLCQGVVKMPNPDSPDWENSN